METSDDFMCNRGHHSRGSSDEFLEAANLFIRDFQFCNLCLLVLLTRLMA